MPSLYIIVVNEIKCRKEVIIESFAHLPTFEHLALHFPLNNDGMSTLKTAFRENLLQ